VGALTKDVRTVARGWRWTHRPLVPRSVEAPEPEPRDFPTAWARTPAARAARAFLQSSALAPLIRFEVDARVEGLDVLGSLQPPAIFVANHTSHLDAPLVLTSLPPAWRERTAVGAAADYFFDVWWRAAATALVFNAFPVERAGARKSTRLARALIADGWNVVVFPEGTRSRDGWVGEFRLGAARLAVETGTPVVPIAVRGSYQAMPRGRAWPVKGRPPVGVRLGRAVTPRPGEDPAAFNERVVRGLAATLDEDRTTWWEAIRREARGEVASVAGPEAPRWRRVWEASRPMPARGRPSAWGRPGQKR
jgi:1-acyl-sn-glycerol-3-phosphate acyltransferase